jgi:hypothetical protein
VPLLQSRYTRLQSPDAGEKDLCSHLDAEHIGNCAILAGIGQPWLGIGAAQSPSPRKNGPVGIHRLQWALPVDAKLDVLLSPLSMSIPARFADFDFAP